MDDRSTARGHGPRVGAPGPEQVTAMVRRLPPAGAPVVPGSTPVLAFGDPAWAEVATLGINPSRVEFLADGRMLDGTQRRLATLASLAAKSLDRLTDAQVASVVADCSAYFQRNPYRRWFDPLDALLREATGTSYYDGTACHLDLVQWATDPVWGSITDQTVRQALLDDGLPHLRTQLAHGNVRVVLLNGRQVIDQVRAVGLAHLVAAGDIPPARTRCELFTGGDGGVRWIGWSTNLQSSWGVSTAFKGDLARWIAAAVAPPTPDHELHEEPVGVDVDGHGHLRRGLRVVGKQELTAVLGEWLRQSFAPTVGDVGAFGGRPWLGVSIGGHEIALNADTKRAAVETFVRDNTREPELPWRVIANNRGRVNKVLPNPSAEPLPGWYAYLTHPLDAPATL